jgi:hypothetical protein
MNPQPTQSFVPLTAAPVSPEKREFRVAVLNSNGNGNGGAENKAAFQSLEMPRAAAFHGAEKKSCEPRVTVQRDGARVTHLRIQCTCGQIMDLACVYDEAPPVA